MTDTRSAPLPRTTPLPVREVPVTAALGWLGLGWGDVWRTPAVSLAHGLAVALFGALLLMVARHQFWWLAGAFTGFLLVAPVLATGLYALSRAQEDGGTSQPARTVAAVWASLDHRLVLFGLLLALAGTGWVVTSAALITWLTPQPIHTPLDFARHIVVAPDGWLFWLWLGVGGLLAAPVFASTVVAVPLLLDRRIGVLRAVLTSWQTVLVNPGPMAAWAFALMAMTLLGLFTAMLGLVLVIPWLGHASWHAYRGLVDAQGVPRARQRA